MTTRSLPSIYQNDPFRVNHSSQPQSQSQLHPCTYQHTYQSTHTRLYGTRSSKDDEKNKSFLQKAADKVKSINPFSKKSSSAALTKKEQAKEDVSTSIDTILKDAPLGVRMLGQMIKPMIGSLVGGMAQAMEEQQKQMSDMLDDARSYIVQDPAAVQLLGEPLEVGSPFSQSSSTMSVNGETRTNLQASFEVRGNRGSGVATIASSNGRIENLSLNVNGRNMAIDVTKRGGASFQSTESSSSWSSSGSPKQSDGIGKNRSMRDDDVIDAEFVEKK
jgi:hypothetical protein